MATADLSPPARRWRPASISLTLAVAAFLAWSVAAAGQVGPVLGAAGAIWSRPDLLALFLATYTLAFALRALAWRALLSPAPPAGRLFAFVQVALLANHLFPTKVGELVRVALLTRAGTPLAAAAASTAVARLLDLASLCLLAAALAPLAGERADTLAGALAPPLVVVLAAGLALWAASAGWLDRRLARGPAWLARYGPPIAAALRTMGARRLALAFLLTLPSWLLEAAALWSVARAIGQPLSPALAGVGTAFTIAFQGFQFTPGGLGLYEASLTGVLTLHGVEPGAALTLALATHGLKFAYSYLVGGACLLLGARADWLPAGGATPLLGSLTRLPAALVAARLLDRRPSRPAPPPSALPTQPSTPSPHHPDQSVPIGAADTASRRWLSSWRADPSLTIALLAVLAAAALAPTRPAWLALAGGTLSATPLALLGRCHHLPTRLLPLLLAVPLALIARLDGPPPLALGLAIALGLAGLASAAGRLTPLAALWAVVLTLAILAGAVGPLGTLLVGLSSLAAIVLARQWWTCRHPLPPPGPIPPGRRLTVVVPVRNEAATIGSVVARVPRDRLAARGFETTVLVVDDGSSDGSGAIAREAGADRVVVHATGRGLGAAVRAGLRAARREGASVAVYLDGDGEYDPADLPAVAEPVLAGRADYVLGSRFPGARGVMRPSRLRGNQGFTALQRLLTGRRISDGQTGFRAFGPRALDAFEIVHDYNYAQVLTLDLLRKGMRLAEVPIAYRARPAGRSFIRYREYARRVLPAIVCELLAP